MDSRRTLELPSLKPAPIDIWNRVYGDFLMPSRLDQYRRLLQSALTAGYSVVSVERFWQSIVSGAVNPLRRYLVLRHDIDIGPHTAGAMWRMEQAMGVEGSYYFRLSTLDTNLMRAIDDAGSQASYHYEELASVIKRHRLRTREDALTHMPEAQDRFRKNLARLRARTGLPMRVVAAHGDFVNRHLGLMNWAILADQEFRRDVGVELEAYDDAFMHHVSSRHADTTQPPYWTPEDPLRAIRRAEPVIYLLVHPCCWRVERLETARGELARLWEGLLYNLPVGSTRVGEAVAIASKATAASHGFLQNGVAVGLAAVPRAAL